MDLKNIPITSTNDATTKNGINLDYDYNTEYGDGDIPEPDKNVLTNASRSRINIENCAPRNTTNGCK